MSSETWTETDVRMACDEAQIVGQSRFNLMVALQVLAARRSQPAPEAVLPLDQATVDRLAAEGRELSRELQERVKKMRTPEAVPDGEREPGWSRFVPTEEIPEQPEEDESYPDAGAVVASWSPIRQAGSVRRVTEGDDSWERLAGSDRYSSSRTRVIRHADGRWADGYNPEGPCKTGCGSPQILWRGGIWYRARIEDVYRDYCTEFCRHRAIDADRAKAKAGEPAARRGWTRGDFDPPPAEQPAAPGGFSTPRPWPWPAVEVHPEDARLARERLNPSPRAPEESEQLAAPLGFRVVGRSGPGVSIGSQTWLQHGSEPPFECVNYYAVSEHPKWVAGEYLILEPIDAPPAPVAEPCVGAPFLPDGNGRLK